MASTFAFGTYLPEPSQVHALKAQVKIVLACAFSVCAFFVETWAGIGILCALAVMSYALAKIPLSNALRGFAPIAFILAFTIVVHAFSFDLGASWRPYEGMAGSIGATQQLALAGSFGLTLDGTLVGLFLALRIAVLLGGCSLLTFTTSLVDLVDGMRALLLPLARLKVPVDEITTIVSLALRFIPTTIEQAQTIRRSQMARGASFEEGNILARLKAWIPVVVPLFVGLFRKAEVLGVALDARCYGVARRTRAHSRPWRAADVVTLVVGLVVLVGVCIAY
ncbi:MAG: energy-coupling factor transporter transmembrane component T family protein [Coriobacteriales bacterium]|jgi:energy-coupling factor transport system permease protein